MSRQRTVMLEDTAPASTRQAPGWPDSEPTASGPAAQKGPSFTGSRRNTGPLPGSRSARKKRGLLRRTGIVGPAIGVAVLVVALVATVSYMASSGGNSGNGIAEALNVLPHSDSMTALEQERQDLIDANAAARTLSNGAKPTAVNPHGVIVASQAAASRAATASNPTSSTTSGTPSGGSTSSGSSGSSAPVAASPDPGSAEAIAQQLMPSFGFSVSGQYSCLYDLWMQESGWRYDAENPSGAYGIPQSLPGSKMASAGSDWQTNPATQIKWGLGYIQSVYGTPCNAWAHEQSSHWY